MYVLLTEVNCTRTYTCQLLVRCFMGCFIIMSFRKAQKYQWTPIYGGGLRKASAGSKCDMANAASKCDKWTLCWSNPAGQYFNCTFNDTAQCRRTSESQNGNLSCYIGMDVLGKLFDRNELRRPTCSAYPFARCDRFCVKVLVKNLFGTSESDTAGWNLLHESKFLI